MQKHRITHGRGLIFRARPRIIAGHLKEPARELTARTRRLFLSPQPTYSRAEAASLLGCTLAELDRSIADGELELTSTGSGGRLAWGDVAAALVDAHPHADIEQAPGADAATVLPQLLMLAELRADIPLYQIATITALAGATPSPSARSSRAASPTSPAPNPTGSNSSSPASAPPSAGRTCSASPRRRSAAPNCLQRRTATPRAHLAAPRRGAVDEPVVSAEGAQPPEKGPTTHSTPAGVP